ncbi:MAG: pyruvate ferredoxin oxidoreductase [Thermoprotei archaeon]|nr:MAG: pyruvate ferredoxin oxidoreductase [Thermoprotei archaeon]RLF20286.1 MAG: pyruvate ferredoxin oxidoreductase [Thermoprotei archaeon]
MSISLPKPEYLAPGHAACQGCGATLIVRQVLMALEPDEAAVIVTATGCLEVVTTIYPRTSWRLPFVHLAFENAAAAASGIETALKVLKRKGLLKEKKKMHVIAIAGDGGTFDIGLQALSGALERGHKFVYICYDNEAYMNTGIQRSGATPYRAWTTTTPVGKKIPGKPQFKKNLAGIAAAHEIPYVATASPGYHVDLIRKVRRALNAPGPALLHIICPCPTGWRHDPSKTVEIARLAVQTRFFPLYEILYGRKYIITMPVPKPLPIIDYLKLQGRYAHLLRPEMKGEVEKLEKAVNDFYKWLERMAEATKDIPLPSWYHV